MPGFPNLVDAHGRLLRDRITWQRRITPGQEQLSSPTYQYKWNRTLTIQFRVDNATLYYTPDIEQFYTKTMTGFNFVIDNGGAEDRWRPQGTWNVDECDIAHNMNGTATITLTVYQEGDWPNTTTITVRPA
jgi:hypothetical protein